MNQIKFIIIIIIFFLFSACNTTDTYSVGSINDIRTMSDDEVLKNSAKYKQETAEEVIKKQKEIISTQDFNLDSPPVLIYSELPQYPNYAKNANIQGIVVIQFIVNENGEVEKADVIKSPDNSLSDASVSAIRKWRFEPMKRNGLPVKVCLIQHFPFRLE